MSSAKPQLWNSFVGHWLPVRSDHKSACTDTHTSSAEPAGFVHEGLVTLISLCVRLCK